MDYMVSDAYSVDGIFRSSWEIRLNYTSDRMPESGAEASDFMFLDSTKNIKDIFLAVFDENDDLEYIRYIKANDYTSHVEEGLADQLYKFYLVKVPVLEGA